MAAVISGPLLLAIGAVIAAIVIWVKNWDDIKAGFSAFIEIIQNTWTIAVNKVKTTINDIKIWFSELKTKLSEVWDGIKEKISTAIDNIKQKFDVLKQKIDTIKQAIQNAWNRIKQILSGSLPTPKIKLPHITISGSWSWNPPKAPSFGVQWYDKAMDNAYLLNGATIFGQMGNQLLGGGESGSEMVVGTDTLMNAISNAMGSQNVTVVLQGDAAEIFRVVRTENQRYYKSNGYSPLTI